MALGPNVYAVEVSKDGKLVSPYLLVLRMMSFSVLTFRPLRIYN